MLSACHSDVLSLCNKMVTQRHVSGKFFCFSGFARVIHWPRNLLSRLTGLRSMFRRQESNSPRNTDFAVYASTVKLYCPDNDTFWFMWSHFDNWVIVEQSWQKKSVFVKQWCLHIEIGLENSPLCSRVARTTRVAPGSRTASEWAGL